MLIGPGSFFTSLMPIFLVGGMRGGARRRPRPGHPGRQPADGGARACGASRRPTRCDWTSDAIGRPVDVVIANTARPSAEALARYAAEHKEPLETGDLPHDCELIEGRFWGREIARHDRRRLAYAVWGCLAQRLL